MGPGDVESGLVWLSERLCVIGIRLGGMFSTVIPGRGTFAWCLRRSASQKIKTPRAQMKATPPTTPPAIAPAWETEEFSVVTGGRAGVDDGRRVVYESGGVELGTGLGFAATEDWGIR